MIEFDETRRGPLDGVRVLDLSRLVAGNMLSLQLADLGADVIKVEPPHGDPLRDWLDDAKPLFWKVYARNKRSIMLNLRIEAGKEALLRLAGRADVLIENFRPGTLEQMALGPEVLHARNPDLILVRISGFGQTGPYAKLPGFGTLVEAMSGLAARTGFAGREPVLPPVARADMIDDPRFASNSERVRNRALVDEAVGAWFARRTREEALAHMRAAGVTVGPVYDIADAVSDAHFREREILVEVEDSELGQIP